MDTKNDDILFNDSILADCESTVERPFKFFEYIFSIEKGNYDFVINELLTFKYLYNRKDYTIYNDDGTVNEVEIRLRKHNTFPKTNFNYSQNIFFDQTRME